MCFNARVPQKLTKPHIDLTQKLNQTKYFYRRNSHIEIKNIKYKKVLYGSK